MTLETTSYTDDAGVTHWTGEVADEFPDVLSEIPAVSTDDLIQNLIQQVEALTLQQENIAGMLATVVEQVGPTLDKLTDHPMLKMFLGGK